MKEFNKLLISFKAVKRKKRDTQLRKGRVMKNVDELYQKYYNAYKSDYGTDDELNEAKKKKFDYKQFELNDRIDKVVKIVKTGWRNKRLKTDCITKMVEL